MTSLTERKTNKLNVYLQRERARELFRTLFTAALCLFCNILPRIFPLSYILYNLRTWNEGFSLRVKWIIFPPDGKSGPMQACSLIIIHGSKRKRAEYTCHLAAFSPATVHYGASEGKAVLPRNLMQSRNKRGQPKVSGLKLLRRNLQPAQHVFDWMSQNGFLFLPSSVWGPTSSRMQAVR